MDMTYYNLLYIKDRLSSSIVLKRHVAEKYQTTVNTQRVLTRGSLLSKIIQP